MDAIGPDGETTRAADLANWQTFSLTYYEPILRAFRLLRVPESEVEELTHSFLVKTAEKNFLDSFLAFREREAQAGRKARFRTYLYRSLQHHSVDFYRKLNVRGRALSQDPGAVEGLIAAAENPLDPDALYALDVLHQALQALRRHCERTGKSHLWVFFEETFLASEYRGRKGKTRAELLAEHPGMKPQDLDNALTTAKRAFRRLVQEVIPRSLHDGVPPDERFAEWMAILRNSNASQFNLLHVAYRVTPLLTAEMSETASLALIVNESPDGGVYEEQALVPGEDELSLLLSFRLEMPLSETLEVNELQGFLPATSPFWPAKRPGSRPRTDAPSPRIDRSFCLLTLIEPTSDEAKALAGINFLGLLGRLKTLAKQLRHHPDQGTPEVFAQLLYTTISVLALVRFRAELHSIGTRSMAGNVRWFLRQTWLDPRLRPLLLAGLSLLEGSPPTVT